MIRLLKDLALPILVLKPMIFAGAGIEKDVTETSRLLAVQAKIGETLDATVFGRDVPCSIGRVEYDVAKAARLLDLQVQNEKKLDALVFDGEVLCPEASAERPRIVGFTD